MSNESYLEGICAQIARVPRDLALKVAAEVFEQSVQGTRIDSGQAALNWRFVPYTDQPLLEPQEMMWGFGDTEPTTPAGYKWSKYDNSETVYRVQFEYLIDQMSAAPDVINGVVVYNPITEGYANFAPGDDTFYPRNAFGNLDMDSIVNAALERAYSDFNNAHT